jgi:hypothetical protein
MRFFIRVKNEEGRNFLLRPPASRAAASESGGNGGKTAGPESMIPLDDSDFKDF